MMGMPSCRDVAQRLSREHDAPDAGARALSLRMHLLICRQCRRYEQQLLWLRRALQQARPAHATLPAPARERIRRHLREHETNRPGL